MANDITKNPFILDTVADDIVASTIKLRPKLIVYSGGTTAAHTAQIEDGSENVKFLLSISGNGDMRTIEPPKGFTMDGLSLGVLGSGKVYLYF